MADKLSAAPPPAPGNNVTDALRREAFWACVKTANALASAQANHRNEVKRWKEQGVDPSEIGLALKARKQDPGDLLQGLRGQSRMLIVAGILPDLRETLFAGLDVAPPTEKEARQADANKARDEGYFAGKDGDRRDNNPHPPGSDLHVEWDYGYMEGQAAIAARMDPDAPAAGRAVVAQPRQRGRRRADG